MSETQAQQETAELTESFQINGRSYQCDSEVLNVLRSVCPDAKATGDSTAVMAVMCLGEFVGRIREKISRCAACGRSYPEDGNDECPRCMKAERAAVRSEYQADFK